MDLAGHDLLTIDEDARRKLRGRVISLVFQDALSALNPVLSIGDQLGELYRTHLGVSRKEARERSIELLRSVHLASADKQIDDYPHQFSGGMRQRILIASAIALKPEVLIADEPTTALDVTVQAQILDLLDELREELGMAILLITHDLGVVCPHRRTGGGDVCRSPCRNRQCRRHFPRTGASIYGSAACLGTAARDCGKARADQGLASQSRRVTARLRLQSALHAARRLCTQVRPDLISDFPHRSRACHYPLVETAHVG